MPRLSLHEELGVSRLLVAVITVVSLVAAGQAARSIQQASGPVDPANRQHNQFTVAIPGKTCSQLPTGMQDRFRGAMRADVVGFLKLYNLTDAAATISSQGDGCFDIMFDGKPYAALRAHTWFYNVTSSVWRDTLFDASRRQMCKGGFNNGIWYMVNDLVVSNGLTVSQNNGSRCPTEASTSSSSIRCQGWIPYASPDNPACIKSSPSPKPSAGSQPSQMTEFVAGTLGSSSP